MAKKGYKKREYTADEHKQAYLAWAETGSRQAAADIIGGEDWHLHTVQNWARSGFRCQWGCPYHGWDDLKKDKEDKLAETITNADVESDLASISDLPAQSREEALAELVCSDLEQLLHWEAMYNKALYFATGFVRQSKLFETADGKPLTEKQLIETYRRGLLPKTFEQGINTIVKIQEQWIKARERVGLGAKKGQKPPTISTPTKEAAPVSKQLSIDELRELQDMPPDKLALLAKVLKSENVVERQILLDAAQSDEK
jgi:hypothetical protein